MIKKEVKVLPNPHMRREPIVSKCEGCDKVFENHALPELMGVVDVCCCYEKPEAKWINYKVETEKQTKKGKEVDVFYHYNPCPMATHIKHSPKEKEIRGVRRGWKRKK